MTLAEWTWTDDAPLARRRPTPSTILLAPLFALGAALVGLVFAALTVVGILSDNGPIPDGGADRSRTGRSGATRSGSRRASRPASPRARAPLAERVARHARGESVTVTLYEFAWSTHVGTRELEFLGELVSWQDVYDGRYCTLALSPVEVASAVALPVAEADRLGIRRGHLRCVLERRGVRRGFIASPQDLAFMAVLGGARCPEQLRQRPSRAMSRKGDG